MQDKLCKLPGRYAKLAEMSLDRVNKKPTTPYGWIFDRHACKYQTRLQSIVLPSDRAWLAVG